MPPLVLVAVAWAIGLLLAHYLLAPSGVEPAALLILAVVPLAATVLWWRDRSMRLSGVCALALLAGALRYQAALPDWTDQTFVAHYNGGGWLTVEGVVHAYPDVRDTWTNLRISAEMIEVKGQVYPVHGTLLVRAPRFPKYSYGDRLQVSGLMETPPALEGFSYEEYLRTVQALGLGYPAVEEAFRRAAFNLAAVNQDDHVKNFAFLMDPDGAWRLAPAYDLTYARGLGYTRAHQMTLGGKTGRFVREDLLELGRTMGIRRRGAAVLDQVAAGLARWEKFAEAAGVHPNRVRFIASEFRRF